MKLKLNLYPVVPDIEERLVKLLEQATEKRVKIAEIALGPASESVKKRILNFLNKKEIRPLYWRLEKTEKGWSRIFLHFKKN